MRTSATSYRCIALWAVSAVFCGVASAGSGPDVIVSGYFNTPVRYGFGPGTTMEYAAYSFSTVSCNVGDTNLNWVEESSDHPVIATNVYRVDASGRFEQLALSWVKHGFCALQESTCASCQPAGAGCYTELGVGCSDPYAAGQNGFQGGLGPRSRVNGFTGEFPWPQSEIDLTDNTDPLFKRMRLRLSDLNPALNLGSTYWFEAQYVARDDAMAGNGFNNASSSQIFVSGSFPNYGILHTPDSYLPEIPAILRWPDQVAGAVVDIANVPGEGRFHVGAYVRNNLDGTWTYNYAVHNLNSDRAADAFAVPVDPAVTLSQVGFHDVDYHSGEPYSNIDWDDVYGAGILAWSAESTFAEDPNANALRWGTAYTFWFTANTPPVEGTTSLGLFKPGTPASVSAALPVPDTRPRMLGDVNDDGALTVQDIAPFVRAVMAPGQFAGEYPTSNRLVADFDSDGAVTTSDIGGFVAALIDQANR